jgi:Skp family chaperone for outer membrane proteins
MKKCIITTAFCVTLMTVPFAHAADKSTAAKNLSASNILSDSQVSIDANIGFVESFTIMGECEEGKKARQDIEQKRDLAALEIQEESKKFEKSKNDYIAKSTTMTDSARAKAEKDLMKKENDIKMLVAEKEEDLKMDMQLATETLAQGLEAGVAKLAKNENLDVVFDKMTGRAIYVSEKFDYTAKAVKEVNKTYEVKLAQNKKAEETVKVADNKAAVAKPAKVGA